MPEAPVQSSKKGFELIITGRNLTSFVIPEQEPDGIATSVQFMDRRGDPCPG